MTPVAAAELYRITKDDLVRGIEAYRSGSVSHDFGESTRFDLLVDRHRRLPPKAVVGLAAEATLGQRLGAADFSGGESSAAFRLLWDRGFEIATKRHSVGDLDSTFSVGRDRDQVFLIIESQGPERNTEYRLGLEQLLRGLSDLDATLTDATIDSVETRRLPEPERRISVEDDDYPIRLRNVEDIRALRLKLGAAMAATARAPNARGPGNRTKRLRVALHIPGEPSLHELVELLAQGGETPSPSGNFRFQPRPPGSDTEPGLRTGVGGTVVARLHAEMQEALYASLVESSGVSSVASEQQMCSGRPADIVVKTEEGFEVYEIKTATSPRDCVRQALGQLLEYSYWPGSPPCTAIWVVGPSPLDAQTHEYLKGLRQRFDLPIDYLQQRPGS